MSLYSYSAHGADNLGSCGPCCHGSTDPAATGRRRRAPRSQTSAQVLDSDGRGVLTDDEDSGDREEDADGDEVVSAGGPVDSVRLVEIADCEAAAPHNEEVRHHDAQNRPQNSTDVVQHAVQGVGVLHDFPGPVHEGDDDGYNGGPLEGKKPGSQVVEVIAGRDDIGRYVYADRG